MKIDAACTALSLDDKQCGYFDRDGVIRNLGEIISMFINIYEIVRRRRLLERGSLVSLKTNL